MTDHMALEQLVIPGVPPHRSPRRRLRALTPGQGGGFRASACPDGP